MASDPPNTGAAFTYSLELDVIKIQALNAGTKRVADDIKNVLYKIESWHQGPIIGYRITYLESNGLWTGVDWDGKSVGFFALGETEESAAAKKLIAIGASLSGVADRLVAFEEFWGGGVGQLNPPRRSRINPA